MVERVKRRDGLPVRLMCDSGAFSAQYFGESIDLDAYIAFLKINKDLIDTYVNLDVIPGEFRKAANQAQVEASAKASYDNLQYMKRKGLSPIPVFHQGERFYWLERLLGDGEPYIGLSTVKGLFINDQRRWLDAAFTIVTNGDGTPKVMTHGFGITAFPLMFRYPWTTVDSTTWSLTAGYGKVLVPRWGAKGWVWDKPPMRVIMSGILQSQKTAQKAQFALQGPMMQKIVTRWLQDECGISIAEARYDDQARRKATLIYFMRLVDNWPEVRFKYRQTDWVRAA